MTVEDWYQLPATYLWQVGLHSLIAGSVFFAWARHYRLAPGRPKRCLLGLLLVLPLVSAAIPGRSGPEFRTALAWFDSGRILDLPLPLGLHLAPIALLVAAVSVIATLVQEVLPIFRRPRADLSKIPERLASRARLLPDAAHYRLGVLPHDHVVAATTGTPSSPFLLVSRGALARLDDDELLAALLHERAHWNGRRWLVTHALWAVRLLQCWNPVALWVFRAYLIQVEAACDAEAVEGRDRRPLMRTLLKVYEDLENSDDAARRTLRMRIDALRAGTGDGGDQVSVESVVLANLVLLLTLPWVV